MNRIWIRKPVDKRAAIVISFSGVFLLLIGWHILTFVKPPPVKINKTLMEKTLKEVVVKSAYNDLIKYYDLEGDYYKRNSSDRKATLHVNKILKDAGYSYKSFPDKLSIVSLSFNFKSDSDKEIIKRFYNFKTGRLESAPSDRVDRIILYSTLKKYNVKMKGYKKSPIISANILPHFVDIFKAFPGLIKGGKKFTWKKSLIFAVWVSLRREMLSFAIVIIASLPIGLFMSCNNKIRAYFKPMLVVGTFIPIAALIPLTQAFFGIGEFQKIMFLSLGMFFVLLGLVMKEMDEVDKIYLETGYTLGFTQLQTVFLVNFPIALPRIWKHFSAIFGLGWGYIIFAEMINIGGQDAVNGIGWLFIARKRRLQMPDMYAIFFVIIGLAFLFDFIFKKVHWLIFKHKRKTYR